MHAYWLLCDYAGQALVDGVTAACYNVIFTSIPILLFAVLDRPVQHFATLIRYPQASLVGLHWLLITRPVIIRVEMRAQS